MTKRELIALMVITMLVAASSVAVVIYFHTGDHDLHQDHKGKGGNSMGDSEGGAISSAEELALIGTSEYPLSGDYYLTNNITFDINVKSNFTPIGSMDEPFTGTFDGKGYEISGLNIFIDNTKSRTYAGLFGYISGATIMNLGIVDSTVTSAVNTASSDYSIAGSIVGFATGAGTQMINCYSTGDVMSTVTKYSRPIAGGLVGCMRDGDITITNSYNAGNVTSTYTQSRVFAGGIIGAVDGWNTKVTVTDSFNAGDVNAYAVGDLSSAVPKAGGIIGSTIDQPFGAKANQTGGGIIDVTVERCYNTGTISSTAKSTFYQYVFAGGIISSGHSQDMESLVSTVTLNIIDCYNAGPVRGETQNSPIGEYISAGGILGNAISTSDGGISNVTIANCYNTGEVKAVPITVNSVTVAGGIMGGWTGSPKIYNCYVLESIVSTNGVLTDRFSTTGSKLDGNAVSSTPRDGPQGSGVKTADDMRVDVDIARAGNSIYYIEGTNGIAGWDFYNVWLITEGENNGYPILRPSALSEVTYESNGGSSVDSESVLVGYKATQPADPARPGYTFNGWFTDDGTFVNKWDFGTPVMDDMTLYAEWEFKDDDWATVTYDPKGGSYVPAETLLKGTEASEPPDPEKVGYAFTGWFTDDDTFLTEWNFTTDQVMGDMTLYAKWEVDASQWALVTYESNGGSLVDSESVLKGAKATEPDEPMRQGFMFKGWFTDDGTFQDTWDFGTPVMDDMTLYAEWGIVQVTSVVVMYESNGGSSVCSESFPIGGKATQPTDPVRSGYTFKGWFTDDGTFQDTWDFETQVVGDMILYAEWETGPDGGPGTESPGDETTVSKPVWSDCPCIIILMSIAILTSIAMGRLWVLYKRCDEDQ
ncbi:MAG: InlB B-repeat-containing protein [Methanomassiliicoccaceae archaeon]|nr:InlB B-repeat-containing protein [Methanomassiliicoccaceae archaeon]